MAQRVLCKFFAHGACLKGEHCEYSHDWKAPPNNICRYYQKGICVYGNQCRYDHIKTSYPNSSPQSSSSDLSSSGEPPSTTTTTTEHSLSLPNEPFYPPPNFGGSKTEPAGQPMDRCPVCGRRCRREDRPEEMEEHVRACERRRWQVEAARRSREVECSVCLEAVLSKPEVGERRFGILSECDHPFCITCIRSWRSSGPTPGPDAGSASRSCPVCRMLSYFVVPSGVWFSSREEKQAIVESYKARLRSIDCKHFDFGEGSCPFGSSCFYKHAYRDGSLEETVLAHLGSDDEDTVNAKDLRLSEFINNLRL